MTEEGVSAPVPAPTAGPESLALFERAVGRIPGGVNSPVRAFGSVGGNPYFVASGEGAYVTDVDGRRYVDWVQSWGAIILGHAHPKVVEAVERATRLGTTFGAPTEAEVRLAESVCAAVTGCEMLRLVSTGTEAAMTAVRLARAGTGRNRIVKFAGCYHGHSDALLAAAGSGVATLGLASSAGVTPGAVADTLVVPYNHVPSLDRTVAAVIIEPVAANMGLVGPRARFLDGVREECDKVGAVLIFDEVITGFRLRHDGASGAYGITPDLWCFGKVIGGGLPLAAVGGRTELMQQLAPVGEVYQAGTLSGNPLATAAGLAVLDELEPGSYLRLSSLAEHLASALSDVFSDAGVPATVPVVGPLFSIFFGAEPVSDYEGAVHSASNGLYAAFFREMLARGIALAPSAYEVAFLGFAHGAEEVERTLEAAREAAAVVSRLV
jgi:glutamate-1-semialdehyde 2,1-aminomutase